MRNDQPDPWFFGYGSLVNRQTHDYPDAIPARLAGWRRVWQPTDLRELAFLSVEPAPDSAIDGLIARVPGADWALLDQREYAYDRQPVTAEVTGGTKAVQVYVVAKSHRVAEPHPIPLSYLDTVVQGFLAEFGPAGVRRFFDSTNGWDSRIMDDRTAPIYPRATRLCADEMALVDAELTRVGAGR